jgi:hypothetical protein
LYALTFVGVGYGTALAYTGQMPDEKYFKGKNIIPAPKIIPIPLPEKLDLNQEATQEQEIVTAEPKPNA